MDNDAKDCISSLYDIVYIYIYYIRLHYYRVKNNKELVISLRVLASGTHYSTHTHTHILVHCC